MGGYQAINRPLLPWDRELSDPRWRGWFDALKAQGVDKLADSSVGVARGMWSNRFGEQAPYVPTFDPNAGQTSSVGYAVRNQDGSNSFHRDRSTSFNSPALDGINAVVKKRR